MEPKPRHLGPEYGAQFEDCSVARRYATRPAYPRAVFDVLEGLLPKGDRSVLDLGCGSGEIALGLSDRVDGIDAVDPSEAMLAVARLRRGADHAGIRWIRASAETFGFRGPYSLVVAGESLHWMEWSTVLPRIAAALAPGGALALVDGRTLGGVPFQPSLLELIARLSTNRDFQPCDLVDELTRRGLFRELGRTTTPGVATEQPLDDYVESFHTRNGLSRERMTAAAASEFDDGVRTLALSHFPDGIVRGHVTATIVWGAAGRVGVQRT